MLTPNLASNYVKLCASARSADLTLSTTQLLVPERQKLLSTNCGTKLWKLSKMPQVINAKYHWPLTI